MDLDHVKGELAREGFAILPNALSRARADEIRACLWRAAEESEKRGVPTHYAGLDPNARNVRVFNLLDLDPVFVELIADPRAIEIVRGLLGAQFLISNFTANIALPGSKSMALHSDQSIVIPEPWFHPWAINIIWCLTDVHAANGATLYLPRSHLYKWVKDVPADALARMKPFEARAGSIIVMEGRMWHTSGANTTESEERALLFGYYARDFIRPQINWNAALSPSTIASLTPQMQAWLGLPASANVNLGMPERRQ